MKTLIIGDTHISEKNISELEEVFKEIFQIKADKLIHLGDFFDKALPTPKELFFGTQIANAMKIRYPEVVILEGNGGHEYYHNANVTDYLKFLGINVIKGNYEFDNMLFGHFMCNESKLEYGTGRCSAKSLSHYKYSLLGHQHSSEQLLPNVIHLGSVIYTSFNEVNDNYKRIAIIEDDKLTFVPLKSTIPMKDIYSIEEVNKLDNRTKVRLIFKDFKTFKNNINIIKDLKNKFYDFRIQLDFKEESKIIEKEIPKEKIVLEELFIKAIENIQDNDVKLLIKESL